MSRTYVSPRACSAARRVRATIALSLLAIAVHPAALVAAEQDHQIARYTSVAAGPAPAEKNPLEAVVAVHFPRSHIHTVGQAVHYLLLRTGYRLATTLSEPVHEVMKLPLPEVHRDLGPYTVRTALSVLLGQPFELSTNPTRREVAYHIHSDEPQIVVPPSPVAQVTPVSPLVGTAGVPISGTADASLATPAIR